ncbi:MAG: TlpA family protein disulfide reductase, partial [Polaromonas sp.]
MKRIWLGAAAAAVVLALAAGVFLGSGAQAAPESTFVLLDGSRKSTA